MTTSDLERRLTEVLQQHAEEPMNSTRTEEQLSTLLEDAERHERRRRLGWAGGTLAAAAVAVALVVWSPGGSSDQPDAAVPSQSRTEAEDVATSFVDAYTSFDRDTAASYLHPDAWLGIGENWRRENRWFEAAGFVMQAEPCEASAGSAAGTPVRCPFDYHGLGSDELGRGPYSGNMFTFTVQDGRIVAADKWLDFMENGFSEEMWEPFAAWVSKAYPKDAAVMYADWPGQSLESHSDRSLELWAQHIRDYVQVEQGR